MIREFYITIKPVADVIGRRRFNNGINQDLLDLTCGNDDICSSVVYPTLLDMVGF